MLLNLTELSSKFLSDKTSKNSVTFSPQENYTDRAAASFR